MVGCYIGSKLVKVLVLEAALPLENKAIFLRSEEETLENEMYQNLLRDAFKKKGNFGTLSQSFLTPPSLGHLGHINIETFWLDR